MKNKSIRKDDEAVSPVIAVILMVAITVVLSGVLYVWIRGIQPQEDVDNIRITAIDTEKSTHWEITIASISGTLAIDDLKFQMIDSSKTALYNVDINDANPSSISRGESTIFPIPSGSGGVLDNSTNSVVTENSELKNYEYCYIAYNDQNNDERVSAGDNIWVYKDFNNNGIDDIKSNYKLQVLVGKNIPLTVNL